jgi:hypothetical protein
MRRIALTAAALLASMACAGCHTMNPAALTAFDGPTGPGGPGTGPGFSYSAGRAVQTFPQAPLTVQPAVLAAMEDLRMHSVRQKTDAGAVVFEGTTADDRKAYVTVRPNAAGTRISVRIGLFGDEILARAVMDRVGIRLGSLPPSAVPAEPPSSPEKNPYFSRSAVPDSVMLKGQAEAPYRDTPVPN